jgi:hypothetical protein
MASPCGKITVFRANADEEDAVLVKRVLGLPGVKIALRDSELLLNGVPTRNRISTRTRRSTATWVR